MGFMEMSFISQYKNLEAAKSKWGFIAGPKGGRAVVSCWHNTHFVASHFWLVIQCFYLVPVQDDLGVWRIPYDVPRGLTWCYSKI